VTRAAVGLWLRIAATTGVAWATFVLIEPPVPSASMPWSFAAIGGCGLGILLFTVVARRLPVAAPSLRPGATFAAKNAMLAIWATNEELLWRRVLLGEALRGGALFALVASTVGFAAVHRTRRKTHVATGAVFGASYLASGSLLAPIVAHWAYNVLLAAELRRARARAVEAPA
jgi:membrane protease YdiL (CAAX protease family)